MPDKTRCLIGSMHLYLDPSSASLVTFFLQNRHYNNVPFLRLGVSGYVPELGVFKKRREVKQQIPAKTPFCWLSLLTGGKVVGIRRNPRHRGLAGHGGKGRKEAVFYLLRRNGAMRLHQPPVRKGRAKREGRSCCWQFSFLLIVLLYLSYPSVSH